MTRTLTGDGGSLAVDLGRGAKITSLVDPGGREWLTTRALRQVDQPGRWGFTEAEMCGWDECAPTIAAAILPDGRPVADHGEVWDRPWQLLGHTRDELSCRVVDERLGFALERRITTTALGFRFEYTASTRGSTGLPWLWAAHPQFRAEGVRVTVPGLSRVRQTHPDERLLAWDEVPQPAPHSAKYWADDPALPPQALLEHARGRLVLGWQGSALRGVAVWFDAGDHALEPCLAVEPATGRGDRVTDLDPPAEVARLEPGQPLEWAVTVDFLPTAPLM